MINPVVRIRIASEVFDIATQKPCPGYEKFTRARDFPLWDVADIRNVTPLEDVVAWDARTVARIMFSQIRGE